MCCVAACHCIDTCTTLSAAQVAATWLTTFHLGGFFKYETNAEHCGDKLVTNVANVTTVDYDSEAVASLSVLHHLTLPLTIRCLIINKAT